MMSGLTASARDVQALELTAGGIPAGDVQHQRPSDRPVRADRSLCRGRRGAARIQAAGRRYARLCGAGSGSRTSSGTPSEFVVVQRSDGPRTSSRRQHRRGLSSPRPARSPATHAAMVDLPEPDSPTSPSDSPGSMVNVMSSTIIGDMWRREREGYLAARPTTLEAALLVGSHAYRFETHPPTPIDSSVPVRGSSPGWRHLCQ